MKVLFQDNGLNGLFAVKEDGWKNGILLSCPLEQLDDLCAQEEMERPGIFLSLTPDGVSIDCWQGVSHYIDMLNYSCSSRLEDGFRSGERVVLLTTEGRSFSTAGIDYLAMALKEKAKECGTLSQEGSEKTKKHKIEKFEKVALDQYLEEALFVMEFMGINAFSKRKSQMPISSVPTVSLKTEALAFLKNKGVDFGARYVSYAKMQTGKEEFWNNARAESIVAPWVLVLNNQIKRKLYVLEIPAKAFETSKVPQKGKVLLRSDKPYYLDLHLDSSSLVDNKSAIDFSRYVTATFDY